MVVETDGGMTDGMLRKKSLRDEVYELLQNRIVSGKFAPGEWLRQEEIASQLGVSQTPVREALDLLVSNGLAERVPYRGVHVISLSQREIVEAYIMRLVLETLIARLAACNRTPERLTTLLELLSASENLTRLEDMPELREVNKALHKQVALASGNTLLASLYEITANKFPDWMLYEYMFRRPDILMSTLAKEHAEHQALISAIADQNPDDAARAAARHVRELGDQLETFLGVSRELLEAAEQQIAL
jgi:GntR family transcriptional regulator, rspAB operon transcriptional repressor